jgi:hypothetical protein
VPINQKDENQKDGNPKDKARRKANARRLAAIPLLQ